jgi:Enoyl-(Acyl carrier protein) reductase
MSCGAPEEIARVVCFLAADASAYITGQIWAVNGGLDMSGRAFMAKQLHEQTQHLAKSIPGVFRFGENHPDSMMANVLGMDDEHGHYAVKRCGRFGAGRSGRGAQDDPSVVGAGVRPGGERRL